MWIQTQTQKPPESVPIMTKIDDDRGIRNEQILFFRGNMFWTEITGGMYVYYTPTHWRELTVVELETFKAERKIEILKQEIELKKKFNKVSSL